MELRAHGVVVVPSHGADQTAVLPVPDTDRLVIGATQDPGELVVEEDSADVVQMSVQGEQTPAGLVGPDLDLVIVTAGDEPAVS